MIGPIDIGGWTKLLLQGGPVEGPETLQRFFAIHVFLLPALMNGGLDRTQGCVPGLFHLLLGCAYRQLGQCPRDGLLGLLALLMGPVQ